MLLIRIFDGRLLFGGSSGSRFGDKLRIGIVIQVAGIDFAKVLRMKKGSVRFVVILVVVHVPICFDFASNESWRHQRCVGIFNLKTRVKKRIIRG